MKANELMIGDWVYVSKNFTQKYHKIRALSNDEGAVLRGIYVNEYGVENNSVFSPNDTEPIPLTPEILEKNGMHLYNSKTNSFMEWCNHSDCFKEDENYMVELSLDNDGKIRWTINGDEYTIMPLDYVHQLQQALRLCGIEKEIEL